MVRPESTFTAATGSFTEASDAGGDAASMDPGGFGEAHPADHDVLTRPDSLARRAAQPTRDLSSNTALRQSTRPADSASDSAHESVLVREPARPAAGNGGFGAWAMRYTARLMILDGLVGMLAVLTTAFLFPNSISFATWKLTVLTVGAGALWPVAVAISRGYERSKIGVGGDEMRAVLRAAILAIACGAVPSTIIGKPGVVAVCVMATPIAVLASLAVRFISRKHLHHQQRLGRNVRKVIVVGSAYAAADLNAVLNREQHAGMTVIGVCVPAADVSRAHDAGLAVIGDLEQVPALIKTYGADAVAVTSGDATRHNYLRELSWALEGAGVELLVHPGLIEVAGPRMHIRPYVGLPLLHVEQPHFTGWRRLLKRATDIVLTSLGILVISPVLAAIALAVKVSDRGPVIFRQTRVGLDGSTFTMFKFRSMHTDAETKLAELRAQNPNMGTMFKMEDDPRITRVGRFLRRFSLDELPQLFNVLGGTMSLVGPRPPLQSEVDVYEDHARRRLLVTPGLTGLWQVSGRSLLSWEETVRLDLRYVENWTLTLDLLIMWKTFFAVVAKRGAF
jgi:exopolysaccharide biosynthesis polyprenyl glycosylphosphotransferase